MDEVLVDVVVVELEDTEVVTIGELKTIENAEVPFAKNPILPA